MFVNAAPFPHDLLVIIADHHTIFLIGSCYYCFLKNREQLHTQVQINTKINTMLNTFRKTHV